MKIYGKYTDFLQVQNNRVLVTEVHPIAVASFSDQSGEQVSLDTKTEKWMHLYHWQDLQRLLDDIVEEYEIISASLEPTETFPVNEAIKRKKGNLVTIAYKWREYKRCCRYYLSPKSGDTSESSSDDDLDDLLLSRLSNKPLKKVGSNSAGHSAFRPCSVLLQVSVAPLSHSDVSAACILRAGTPSSDATPPPVGAQIQPSASATVQPELVAPAVNGHSGAAVNGQPGPAVSKRLTPTGKRQRELLSDSDDELPLHFRKHNTQSLPQASNGLPITTDPQVPSSPVSTGSPAPQAPTASAENSSLSMTELCAALKEKRAAKKKQKRDTQTSKGRHNKNSRQEKYSVFDSPSPDHSSSHGHALAETKTQQRPCEKFKASTPVLFKQPKETILEKFCSFRSKSSKVCVSRSPVKQSVNPQSSGVCLESAWCAAAATSPRKLNPEPSYTGVSSQFLEDPADYVPSSKIFKVDSSALVNEAWTRGAESCSNKDCDRRSKITGYKDELSSPPHSPLYDPTCSIFGTENPKTSSELRNVAGEDGFQGSVLNMSPTSNSHDELEPLAIASMPSVSQPPADYLSDCVISERYKLGPCSPDIFSNATVTEDLYAHDKFNNSDSAKDEENSPKYSYNPDADVLEERLLATVASCSNNLGTSSCSPIHTEEISLFAEDDATNTKESNPEVQHIISTRFDSDKVSQSKTEFSSNSFKRNMPTYEVSDSNAWIRCVSTKFTEERLRVHDESHTTQPDDESQVDVAENNTKMLLACEGSRDTSQEAPFENDGYALSDAAFSSELSQTSEKTSSISDKFEVNFRSQNSPMPRLRSRTCSNHSSRALSEDENSAEVNEHFSREGIMSNSFEQEKESFCPLVENSSSPILGLRKNALSPSSSSWSQKSDDLPNRSVKCNLYRGKMSAFSFKETGTLCLKTEDSLKPSLQVAPKPREPPPSAGNEDQHVLPSSSLERDTSLQVAPKPREPPPSAGNEDQHVLPSSSLERDTNSESRDSFKGSTVRLSSDLKGVENCNSNEEGAARLVSKSCEELLPTNSSASHIERSTSTASNYLLENNNDRTEAGSSRKTENSTLRGSCQSLPTHKAPNTIYIKSPSNFKRRKREKHKVSKEASQSPSKSQSKCDLFEKLFGESGSSMKNDVKSSQPKPLKVTLKDKKMSSSGPSSPRKVKSVSSKTGLRLITQSNSKLNKNKSARKSKKPSPLHSKQKTLFDSFSPSVVNQSRIENLKKKGMKSFQMESSSDDELPDIQSNSDPADTLGHINALNTDSSSSNKAPSEKHLVKQRKKSSSSFESSSVASHSTSSDKTPDKNLPSSNTSSPSDSTLVQTMSNSPHKSSKTIRSEGRSLETKLKDSEVSSFSACTKSVKYKFFKDQKRNLMAGKKSNTSKSEVKNKSKENKSERELVVSCDEAVENVLPKIDESSSSMPEFNRRTKRNPPLPRRYDQYVDYEFPTASWELEGENTSNNLNDDTNNDEDVIKKKKSSLDKKTKPTSSTDIKKRTTSNVKKKKNVNSQSTVTSAASDEQTFLHDWLMKKEILEKNMTSNQSKSNSRCMQSVDSGSASSNVDSKTSPKSKARLGKNSNTLTEKPSTENSDKQTEEKEEEDDDLDLNYSIDSWGNTISPKKNRFANSTVCLESSAFEDAGDDEETNREDPLMSLLWRSNTPTPPHCQPELVREVMSAIDQRYNPEAILDWLPSQLPWLRDVLCGKEANNWHSTYVRGVNATEELNSFLYYGLLSSAQITTITDFLTENMEAELKKRFRHDPRPFHTYTWRVQVPLVTTRMCCIVSGLSWEKSTELLVRARALKPSSSVPI